jgi:endonuclease IV
MRPYLHGITRRPPEWQQGRAVVAAHTHAAHEQVTHEHASSEQVLAHITRQFGRSHLLRKHVCLSMNRSYGSLILHEQF